MIDTNKTKNGQAESLPLAQMMKELFRTAVREALYAVVEEVVRLMCGPSHRPDVDSAFRRADSANSTVFLDGRQEALKRPRVREHREDGSFEVTLARWKAARDPAQWQEATMCGVSTRDVARLGEQETRGLSKSAVSRLWQKKAVTMVEQMQQSDLSGFDLLVLLIDAVVLAKVVVATVALGIDTNGRTVTSKSWVTGSVARRTAKHRYLRTIRHHCNIDITTNHQPPTITEQDPPPLLTSFGIPPFPF